MVNKNYKYQSNLKTKFARIVHDLFYPDMLISIRQMHLLKKTFGENKLTVEIGSYCGATTKHLAKNNRLIAIDPLIGDYDSGDGCSDTLDTDRNLIKEKLKKNIKKRQVIWLKEKSEDVFKRWKTPIDNLFIDGEHTLEGVKRDSQWIKFVKKGGHFAFHDYGNVFPEIKDFIEQKIIPNYELVAKRGNLCIFKK